MISEDDPDGKLARMSRLMFLEWSTLYAPRRKDADPATVLNAFVDDLDEFADDVIQEGWRRVRRTAKSAPYSSTVRDACLAVVKEREWEAKRPLLEAEAANGKAPIDPADLPEPEREKIADACLAGALGEEFCREGLAVNLWGWVKKRGREPDWGEQALVRDWAAVAASDHQALVERRPIPPLPAHLRWKGWKPPVNPDTPVASPMREQLMIRWASRALHNHDLIARFHPHLLPPRRVAA